VKKRKTSTVHNQTKSLTGGKGKTFPPYKPFRNFVSPLSQHQISFFFIDVEGKKLLRLLSFLNKTF